MPKLPPPSPSGTQRCCANSHIHFLCIPGAPSCCSQLCKQVRMQQCLFPIHQLLCSFGNVRAVYTPRGRITELSVSLMPLEPEYELHFVLERTQGCRNTGTFLSLSELLQHELLPDCPVVLMETMFERENKRSQLSLKGLNTQRL